MSAEQEIPSSGTETSAERRRLVGVGDSSTNSLAEAHESATPGRRATPERQPPNDASASRRGNIGG